jgi:putative flavoprotein involved in K+ transport
MRKESIETVVIGGGQAGLTVGYHLQRQGRPFLILDASDRIGDVWRQRWDSLRLFTPNHLNGLDGMRFPGPRGGFPSKDQMADYLEAYASKFDLPVRSATPVRRLYRGGHRFVVETDTAMIETDNVVVAMSGHQVPRVPAFASDLAPGIVQVHSKDYRNTGQLQEGGVLVVGVGNSGADIAMEVAKTHPTWIAGKETAVIPFRIEPAFARHVLVRIVRFVGHRVLSIATPIGRKVRPKMIDKAAPLIRVKPRDLVDAGVVRVPRITEVREGRPVTEDGQFLDVANVIWCTGFRPGFSWIDLPVLGDGHQPIHEAGIVSAEPGLYFVGLHFLYSMTSETVNGVGRDARRIAGHIVAAKRTSGQAAAPAASELVAN